MNRFNFSFFGSIFLLGFMFSCANYNGTLITKGEPGETAFLEKREFSKLSQELLKVIKNKESTKELEALLANAKEEELVQELNTDAKKMAFWVNIYNAYIQITLSENPELYKDRGSFFKKERVKIAGYDLSFDKIEHGLIRSSTVKLSKGYLPKLFPGKIERKFGLKNRDGRIHFVLNCGAKDCPPIYIFEASSLNEDFDKVSSKYLKGITDVDEENKTINTTSLFNWFTGDFGRGKKGIKSTLKKYDIISKDGMKYKLKFKKYDWTLDLGNFI